MLVLAAAALLAYSNSFRVPFVFDDVLAVFDNPTLHSLRTAWFPPSGYGLTVSGRPVLNVTLALNHAISGTEPWSYHALNLLVHIAAAAALFGILWRTLRRIPAWEERGLGAVKGFSLVIALWWLLHPLQTEAVTYVIQRAESLMGCLFLGTIYCFVRSLDSARPIRWRVAAVVCCLFAVGTKEVAALAPVLVLLYDRTFVAGSFREAWSRRRWVHLALFATWLPLVGLTLSQGGDRGGTFVVNSLGVALQYWWTQFEAVARYLWLSIVPWPQVFDYGYPVTIPAAWQALCVVVVVAAFAASVWALCRRPGIGFLAAWFWGILAPTLIVPGKLQAIVEHRMYLPLAAVLVLLGLGAVVSLRRRALAVLAVAAAVAGVLTWLRNDVYRDDLRLWMDAVTKRPGGAIAQANVGTALYTRGRVEEAVPYYRRSIALLGSDPSTHYNLALALGKLGQSEEALAEFARALELNPRFYPASVQKAMVLRQLGRVDEALESLQRAVRIRTTLATLHEQIGALYVMKGQWREAAEACGRALSLDPGLAGAHSNLGTALYHAGNLPGAEHELREALRLNPALAEAHFNLGLVLAAGGRAGEAVGEYAEAVRLEPAFVDARLNLGVARAEQGDVPAAVEQLREAARLAPERADVQRNFANALFESGAVEEALSAYRRSLAAEPSHASTHANFARALLSVRRLADARAEFTEAARLDPSQVPAREMAEKLDAYLREQDGR